MQNGRQGRNDLSWCYSRHRSHLGSRHGRSNAQVDPKAIGATVSRKGCRRPVEPDRVVSRRGVVRCLSCLHRKVPEQFSGEGALATAPPYPTGLFHAAGSLMKEERAVALRRLLAFAVDWFVLVLWGGVIFGAVMIATGGNPPQPESPWTGQAMSLLTMTVPFTLYFALCESSAMQASLGKRALGL